MAGKYYYGLWKGCIPIWKGCVPMERSVVVVCTYAVYSDVYLWKEGPCVLKG